MAKVPKEQIKRALEMIDKDQEYQKSLTIGKYFIKLPIDKVQNSIEDVGFNLKYENSFDRDLICLSDMGDQTCLQIKRKYFDDPYERAGNIGIDVILKHFEQAGKIRKADELEKSAQSPVAKEELSEIDKLCIKWVDRGYLPGVDMSEFLSENKGPGVQFISVRQFKLALNKALEKGLIRKEGRYFKPL
jgi:hypothetical protein